VNNLYTMIAPGRRDAPGALAFADRVALAIQERGRKIEEWGGNYPWETEIPPADRWDDAIAGMLDAFETDV